MGEKCNLNKKESLRLLSQDFLSIMPLFKKKLMKEESFHKDESFQKQKLNHSQFHVLGTLAEHGKLPVSEIGRKLSISTPNMTKILNKLIDEELVLRIPDEKDRRIIHIDITEHGKDLLKEIHSKITDNIACAFATLSDDQLENLAESVKTLKDIISTIE